MRVAYSNVTLSALWHANVTFELFKEQLLFNVGLNFCLVGICVKLPQSLKAFVTSSLAKNLSSEQQLEFSATT